MRKDWKVLFYSWISYIAGFAIGTSNGRVWLYILGLFLMALSGFLAPFVVDWIEKD